MTRTPKQLADAVYTVLVEECGAPDDRMRHSFIRYFTSERFPEWRFQGHLGFGGKCRITSNYKIPHVDCYREDETPDRLAMIDRANARIQELFA